MNNNQNPNRPCPAGPPTPPPHPLTCALILAEQVRSERGRLGVEQYVRCVGPLLPPPLAQELSHRLNIPLPPPPEPPNKKPPEGGQGGLDMQQLLRLMSMMGK